MIAERFAARGDTFHDCPPAFSAVVGPGSLFEARSARGFVPDPEVLRNTVLFIQCDSDANWYEPGDFEALRYPSNSRSLGNQSWFTGVESMWVLFGDGALWKIDRHVGWSTLRKYCFLDQAGSLNRDDDFKGRVMFKLKVDCEGI